MSRTGLNCEGRLFISDRAHLVFDFHQIVDGLKEVELGGSNIGTTRKGIGPAYSSKASRSGLRVHHLFDGEAFATKFRTLVEGRFKRYGHFECVPRSPRSPCPSRDLNTDAALAHVRRYDTEGEIKRYKELAQRLKPYVVDGIAFIHNALAANKGILVEGANALMLDLDFGTYPFVTSSATGIGGVCTGLGLPPRTVGGTYGVIKAYTTRVGAGPFPTEQLNSIGEHLQEVGAEFGVTTGRRRRCGWLDLVVMKYSTVINGYTALNLTKLDVLDDVDTIKVAVAYHLDGKPLDALFPADLDTLARVEVQYVELPGWKQSIQDKTQWSDLPDNCQKYVAFIEKHLGVPIRWIGTGPARESMIDRGAGHA